MGRIQDIPERRQLQFTRGFSLASVGLVLVSTPLIHFAVAPGIPLLQDRILILGALHGALALIAFIAARRYGALVAGRLLAWSLFIVIWLAILLTRTGPYAPLLPVYLVLAPITAAFLVREWESIAMVLPNVLGPILLASVGALSMPMAAIISTLVLGCGLIAVLLARSRDEDRRLIASQAEHLERHAQQLDTLMELSDELILSLDGQDRIVAWNHRAKGLLQDKLGKDITIGSVLWSRLPDKLRQTVLDAVAQARTHARTEVEYAFGEGDARRTFEARLHRIPGGPPNGVALYVRESTERSRQAQEQLEAVARHAELEKLRELDAYRVRFLNTASHELYTPLTPIRLQLELLKQGAKGELTPDQSRSIELLDRNTKRLAHLVGDILEVARIEDGRLQLEDAPVALGTLLADEAAMFDPMAASVNVTLHVKVEDLWVQGDAQRFSQVIGNLLRNAIKFSAPGGTVEARVRRDGGEVILEVTDDGIGLSASVDRTIVEPFVQAHNDPKFGGTGLGLYISNELVEAMGGRLTWESDGPGTGATFRASFPLIEPLPAREGPVPS